MNALTLVTVTPAILRIVVIASFCVLASRALLGATADDLIKTVNDPKVDASAREVAVTQLAKQFPQTHPTFIELYRNASLPRIQRVILRLMATHKMPHIDEAVKAAFTTPETLLKITAAESLTAISETTTFLDYLAKALAENDIEVRWVAAKTLAASPTALLKNPQTARNLAKHSDSLLRQALLAHLSSAPETRELVTEILSEALTDKDPTTCISAATRAANTFLTPSTINHPKERAIIQHLIQRLGDPEPTIAGAAACALGLLMNPALQEILRNNSSTKNFQQRTHIAEVLRKKRAPINLESLLEVIQAGNEAEQLHVCGTLTRIQSNECVPLAQAALKSAFPSVRQSAVYALEVIADPTATATIATALQHPDSNVRLRSAIVLGRRPNSAAALPSLERAAATDASTEVQDAARIAIASLRQTDIAPLLPSLESVQQAAPRESRHWSPPSAGSATRIEDGVVHIGSQKQLLVDDLVLLDLGGAKRQMHRFTKDPRNPVLEQQLPWETMGTASFCTTVHFNQETQIFSLWYTSFGRIQQTGEAISSRAQCIALSHDGVRWKRPNVNPTAFTHSTATNMVGRAPNIVINPSESDPSRRFASYSYVPERNGMSVSFSPDGLHSWSDWKFVAGGGNDVVTVCRNDLEPGIFSFMKWRIGRWHRRAAWPASGPTPDTVKRGLINVTANFADDRLAFDRIATTYQGLDFLNPEIVRTEIYEVTPFIYEGIYFGLPVCFDVSGRGARNVDGPTGLSLMFSRSKDGHGGWVRPGNNAPAHTHTNDELEASERATQPMSQVLDFGRWGEWDATQHYGPSSVLVVDDQIVLYYTGASFGHEPEGSQSDGAGKNVYRTAIGRATMRLDGMVSLHATQQPVAITTKLLRFSGNQLLINANCINGNISIDLLDHQNRLISTSEPITGDSLRHQVAWKNNVDLSTYSNQTVKLRIHLQNGHLYSFHFTDRPKK